jgi:hypothetical protein
VGKIDENNSEFKYGDPSYWENRYENEDLGKTKEWLESYDTLKE